MSYRCFSEYRGYLRCFLLSACIALTSIGCASSVGRSGAPTSASSSEASQMSFEDNSSLRGAMAQFGNMMRSDESKTIALGEASKYVGHLTSPLRTGQLVSRFGRRLFSFHEGIDISASEGTIISAAHSGVVVFSGSSMRGYGNMVVIKGDGLMTVYAHNQRNFVDVGDRVDAGDRIGIVGMTGNASGPHLHFETRVRGADGKSVAVDPLIFKKHRAA